jgi:hypothetical protein
MSELEEYRKAKDEFFRDDPRCCRSHARTRSVGTQRQKFGPLLFLHYPGPVFTPIHRTNDFRQVLDDNPCVNEST